MSCNLEVDFFGKYLWKSFPRFYEILLKCQRRYFSNHCHYRFNSYIYHWSLCYICILKCSLPFVLLTAWQCRRLTSYRENINIEKIFVCERAERASLENFRVLHVPKILFLSLFLLVFRIFCRYNYIFVGYFYYICTFNAVSLLLLAARHYKRLTSYRQNSYNQKIYVCARAWKICLFFMFQKSYFFHYICWYNGTQDILSV